MYLLASEIDDYNNTTTYVHCYSLYVTSVIHLQINLIAPPLYVVTTTTLERADGLKTLNEAITNIKNSIENSGGQFSVKLAVSAV